MSLEEEIELVDLLYRLLDKDKDSPSDLRVINSDDPYDSPVLVLTYNDKEYAIAVEEFPPRENQFRTESEE